jgi:hypothetical protein
MDRSKEDREMLRKSGFAESEVNRLSQLRREHHERERLRIIAENRRLRFARWLVVNGKLTDQIA